MGKKYSPSGYHIIDLTPMGELSNGTHILLGTECDDAKVLYELLENTDDKPILLKMITEYGLTVFVVTHYGLNTYCAKTGITNLDITCSTKTIVLSED